MNTNIQSDIAAARAKLDAVSAELRALEERAKQEATKPWEPKGGMHYLSSNGRVCTSGVRSEVTWRKAGTEYPTREAAESALPYVTFFKRLCCLAQELNPSGKVGGRYWLSPYRGVWEAAHWQNNHRDATCVFETEEAAKRAAEILNRDAWKVPSL